MRDIVILVIVLAASAMALKRPYIGFLCWEWVSLMNPHRMAWGFIVTFPIALTTMLAVLVGTLFYKDKAKLVQHGIVGIQLMFTVWMVITYIFALFPEAAWPGLDRSLKIMLGIFLSYLLVKSREEINGLIWACYLSVGFYGIKGGIFTIVHAGAARVWGPPDSFIGDNNHLACALLMVMPLGAYLMTLVKKKIFRYGLISSMGLIGISVLGSNSRGAFLGLLAVFLFWMRKAPGKQKMLVLMIAGMIGIMAAVLMPQSYWDRMNTVKTYDKDASAMGRINAWWCAFNLAKDRFTGAGFNYYEVPDIFTLYAPNPMDVHAAHSIYFQVLGDHGFVGLGLYLWMGLWTWLLLGKIVGRTDKIDALRWANQLARMLQLSLISYFVAGAFLSLSYYDLYWQLVAVAVILNTWVSKFSKEAVASKSEIDISQHNAFEAQPFVRPIKRQGSRSIAS